MVYSYDRLTDIEKMDFTFLFVTANEHEERAFISALLPPSGDKLKYVLINGLRINIGLFGKYLVAHVHCKNQGNMQRESIMPTVSNACSIVKPIGVIMVGVAFGVPAENRSIGDVLVSKKIQSYNITKRKTGVEESRNVVYEPGVRIKNIFENFEPLGDYRIHSGVLLSGEELIDDKDARDILVDKFKKNHKDRIIGGDMEGIGLAAQMGSLGNQNWMVIKAICDWADNKDEDKVNRQILASKNAVDFCRQVFETEIPANELSVDMFKPNVSKSAQSAVAKRSLKRLQKMYYDRQIQNITLDKDSVDVDEKLWYLSDCSAHLWEKIVEQDNEYILCRELHQLTTEHMSDAKKLGYLLNDCDSVNYINLGVGNISKDEIILNQIAKRIQSKMNPVINYLPFDISPKLLFENVCNMKERFVISGKTVKITTTPMLGDMSTISSYDIKGILNGLGTTKAHQTIFACLGSTIGNFDETALFKGIAKHMTTITNSTLLLDVQFIDGVDNIENILEEIYNDDTVREFAYNAYRIYTKDSESFEAVKDHIIIDFVYFHEQDGGVYGSAISKIPGSLTVQIVFKRSEIDPEYDDKILLWSSKYSRKEFEIYLKRQGFDWDSNGVSTTPSTRDGNCAIYCLRLADTGKASAKRK